MDHSYKPTANDDNKAKQRPNYDEFVTLYRSIIGSCMYAQMLTRCDIGYAVSVLSKYLNSPTDTHMKHAKRLLIYLYITRENGIVYGRDKSQNGSIYGMSDSDFAGDIDNRKSQTGWIFIYNGGAISWRSVQQNCVALSTPEAEYMAASDAAKEGRSLLKLANNIFNKQVKSISIGVDNRAAEIWTRQPCQPSKTKQIDISYHHIRDEVAKGRIKLFPVPSSMNSSDALTKALKKDQHEFLGKINFGYASSTAPRS